MAVVYSLREEDTIVMMSILSRELIESYAMAERTALENMDAFTLEQNAENLDKLRELKMYAINRENWLKANKELIIASCN